MFVIPHGRDIFVEIVRMSVIGSIHITRFLEICIIVNIFIVFVMFIPPIISSVLQEKKRTLKLKWLKKNNLVLSAFYFAI